MRSPRLIIAMVVMLGALVAAFFLFQHFWYQPSYSYVYTDNARIDGTVVRVVAQSGGQVAQLPFDVGDTVEKNQAVAVIKVTVPITQLSPESPNQTHVYQNILSPVSGVVAQKSVDVGSTVASGQPLLTIVDPNNIWVIANIEETSIRRVEVGQRVDIHVDAADETVSGRVDSIIPMTTSVVGRTGPSVVVAADTQDVPVKIVFDEAEPGRLYPGLSVEVTIYSK